MQYYENKWLDLPLKAKEHIPEEINATCAWNYERNIISFNTTLCWGDFISLLFKGDRIWSCFPDFPMEMLSPSGHQSGLIFLCLPSCLHYIRNTAVLAQETLSSVKRNWRGIEYSSISPPPAVLSKRIQLPLASVLSTWTNKCFNWQEIQIHLPSILLLLQVFGGIGVPLERNLSWRAGKTQAL